MCDLPQCAEDARRTALHAQMRLRRLCPQSSATLRAAVALEAVPNLQGRVDGDQARVRMMKIDQDEGKPSCLRALLVVLQVVLCWRRDNVKDRWEDQRWWNRVRVLLVSVLHSKLVLRSFSRHWLYRILDTDTVIELDTDTVSLYDVRHPDPTPSSPATACTDGGWCSNAATSPPCCISGV